MSTDYFARRPKDGSITVEKVFAPENVEMIRIAVGMGPPNEHLVLDDLALSPFNALRLLEALILVIGDPRDSAIEVNLARFEKLLLSQKAIVAAAGPAAAELSDMRLGIQAAFKSAKEQMDLDPLTEGELMDELRRLRVRLEADGQAIDAGKWLEEIGQ